ncbi:DUF2442 domain-containing protein [Algiphilus sp. NNCM1]|uniref:DUF2442 domain-containing protein n=1 Tax=Algiphilus sp. TaxID=1872431 RepID=UPI001CA76755|nr:DUF2442 domain-containing protein [Algiphilus sp.]MBY8965020.1 DUF2442 domain-containing protein [Algiphilus acroporae]MCI5104176.1 DUF2442 domain-containing protein [Algiphilus sp.]
MKTVYADPLRLHRVIAFDGHRLKHGFANGNMFMADLAPWIENTKAPPLLREEAIFARAEIGYAGTAVYWGEDVDLVADNLRNLAIEQAGGIGHERLVEWMARNHLTQVAAAKVIGISRRMLNYYCAVARPIPKTVWLACGFGGDTRPQRHIGPTCGLLQIIGCAG